ncbi:MULTISPECIES: ATP-grasp domain-containing protein [Emticicia]|uniref:ATP-grasp domain-containing protein n=1 Tax=Emticicia TaxID=312278 RepID=UPI00209E8F4E|nr:MULTISPECIES: ATP-grasp domain-containing protein [Emticicia]UTA68413.1 ATP-grasp domain-containing protein [Emticicia sp. 21SJ11W-3]
MDNLLITSAGRRVSLVKAFKKELKLFFPESKVFAVDLNPDLSAACYVADGYFKVGKVTDENYINELLELCLKHHIKLIIPTIDTELQILAKNKQFFKDNGINVIVSDPCFVNICRDKRVTNSFFLEKGILFPKVIDKTENYFPIFIKPYDGSLSRDTFTVRKADELTAYHFSNPKLLFFEFIDPEFHDEYTLDMYYDKNNLLKCVVPRRRIETRGGEISKGLTVKNEIVEIVKEKLNFIEGAIGCITFQVFYNLEKKNLIGIEINARFGGGYPLSYLADANFPRFLISEYLLGKDIEYFDNWKENTLMLRYDHEIIVQL